MSIEQTVQAIMQNALQAALRWRRERNRRYIESGQWIADVLLRSVTGDDEDDE